MNHPVLLAIDQGTTGTTILLVDAGGAVVDRAYREITQYYPRPGWVEHDAEEVWRSVVDATGELLQRTGASPAGVGITNQRETFVIWERASLRPVTPAVVWQCRRSAEICRALKDEGHEALFRARTGLLLDPYFSGTKVRWQLEADPELRHRAESGALAFGTMDSWLVARLTAGREHLTEPSNASRTLLFDIQSMRWDEELCDILGVPTALLPEVRDSSGDFGRTDPSAFLGLDLPIGGVAGDQQAALFGQACFTPGMCKNTYGTGSFVLLNTGPEPRISQAGMLATVAWQLKGEATYAMEGAIFVTGAALQWLRDGLGLIAAAAEAGPIAAAVQDTGGVYLVPAFTGLGAPYWDPDARGLLCGLTRGTSREQVVRAAVEAMAFQTTDVLRAMASEGVRPKEMRVDGGASVMDALLQFQADLLEIPVLRAATAETTALGACFLAGLAGGVWASLDEIADTWREAGRFTPAMAGTERERRVSGWQEAVSRTSYRSSSFLT
ncbi:MAG TPA: glycerol kinase GlpK [Candidatus Dormibacteraeota bacterium]|nr:glycerol kinase GlpK [Candidatus Dormibacteraeota bacterium]